MLIATDALSLDFIASFLFGLLFLLGTALLGNLGHAGIHNVAHHAGIHIAGHAQAPHVGGTHTVGHGTHVATHAPAHSAGQTASTQGNASLLSYLNPTSIVLFLLGFGFFGYVFHNTAALAFPFTLVLAGVSGFIVAALILSLLNR